MYGLSPAIGIAGAVSLLMLVVKVRNWHLLAITALFAQTALIFLSHPVLLSVFEMHGINVFPEIKERMLYASVAKGVISAIFTMFMSWYLISRGKRVFGNP